MKTKYFLGLIGFWLLLALPAGAAIDAIKRNYYTTNANPTIVTSGGGTNLANWKIWTDGALYFAQNREATSTLSSNNFSGLLQYLCAQSVSGGYSTRFDFGSGTDTRSSSSNHYYWFTNMVVVSNGCIFSGQGNAATIFAASPALTGPLIQVGADFNFISGICRFENIRFHGDAGAAQSVGLKFRNVAEPNVLNCEFNGFQYAGIQFNNTNYNHWSQVLNSWFVGGGLGSHCILFDAAPAAITCEAQVRNCLIEPHGGGGITVSNHFRNLSISGCRFSDSSGTSTHAIRVFAGNGFQFIGNNFYPFWPSSVPLIRFDDRASATNINADVSHNIANGLALNNLIWIGTNVQGVTMIGNLNPGGNIVTNGSGGNAIYVRADREKIYTDGDLTAGGTVSAAQAAFTTQSNTTLNVATLNIVNGWNAANATNIPVRALWGSGGTNTAATNGTSGQALYSSGNGGVYWGAAGGGGGAALWFYKSMHPKAAWTATDGATRFWGEYDDSTSVQTNAVWRVPFACTATNLAVKVSVTGTLGSAENVAHQLLVNGSTVGLATTNAWNLAGPRWFTVAGSLSLAAGDVITLQVITPTFTTDPTGVRVDWTVNGTIP